MKPLLRALRRMGRQISAAALEGMVRASASSAPSLDVPPRPPRSIFVLRNNDVGDLLVVTPLFEALRRLFPDAWIAAGVGSWNLDVLWGNPHLSEVLAVNAPWFNKYQETVGPFGRLAYLRSAEMREIAARRFEIGIDVLGSAWGSLLILKAQIPYRMGVRGFAGGDSAVQAAVRFDPAQSVGRSALRFAELLGATELPASQPQIFLATEEREEAERWWAAAEPDGCRRRRLVIAPGGGLAEKRWPMESFAALAAGLFGIPDLSVLVLGGPREEELVAQVASALPAARTFPHPPGLRQAFALLAAADFVVCNSSMALHAAAAFGKPALALLGESFPSASQHQGQWGHPLSLSLGKELPERSSLYTPAEVLRILRDDLLRMEPSA